MEIDLHTEEFRRQNAIYAEKTQDPGDSLVITLDYKEKGTLPQVPQEGNSHFYEQGKYSNQNLSLSGITSILTYRKTSDEKIFIATFSDEKKHFEIDRGTTSTNFEHVPKVSNKLPLTPNEKAIIGDAHNPGGEEKAAQIDETIEVNELVKSLKTKRIRKLDLYQAARS